jgi:hypothetical protein
MPRKQPPKTISQLNTIIGKQNRRREKTLASARRSPFVMELAFRTMRHHLRRLDRDPKYFSRLPNYDEVTLAAAEKHSPLRRKRAQRNNGRKPRKNRALDIGPTISAVFGLPTKRLPRTTDAVIEEYVSRNVGSCKALWRGLRPRLASLGFELIAEETEGLIRNGRYVFVREGRRWSISFGQFQKLFGRARKR